MIETFDNFNSYNYSPLKWLNLDKRITYREKEKKFIDEKLKITLKDYKSKSPQNKFFSFFKDEEKTISRNEEELIISISKQIDTDNKEKEFYTGQTGNYVGKFIWYDNYNKGHLEINIKSRFNDIFLQRMLNFANDVFLDDVSIFGKIANTLDFSKYIIYYMFVQNLEKAFLLGLPKSYVSINRHEIKLRGKIDINRFIKNDIPFKGKISSTSREQKEVQEIIDILYKAVKSIDKEAKKIKAKINFTKNISHIKAHLKQSRSNNYISNETINKAMKNKALQNPIFESYKKILEYAKFIIEGSNLEESTKNNKHKTYGFLVNVAELFEIYVTKLLQKEFPEWSVNSPKILLYSSQFYNRKIIPDIVMKKGADVLVFDTKYKKMLMRGTKENIWDLDRNDFFQINTYMSYYHNHPDAYNIIAGGLLYPIEKEFTLRQCHSETWFGNRKTTFIVDGIELYGLDNKQTDKEKINCIKIREQRFIDRIKKIIEDKVN